MHAPVPKAIQLVRCPWWPIALDRWCDSVGPPLITSGTPPPPSIASLLVVTWNVHAGNGDVEALLASIAARPGVPRPYGVVLLLQEAVRAGTEVPARLALHAAYVPSMRNGRLFPSDVREDHGNAILSTFPLDDLRAIELPLGVMSVHLDPSGHRTQESVALAAYLRATSDTMIVGGDLAGAVRLVARPAGLPVQRVAGGGEALVPDPAAAVRLRPSSGRAGELRA